MIDPSVMFCLVVLGAIIAWIAADWENLGDPLLDTGYLLLVIVRETLSVAFWWSAAGILSIYDKLWEIAADVTERITKSRRGDPNGSTKGENDENAGQG